MSGPESRGHRREEHEEHEEHVNHESWVIPYADMLTLLMCLFLVLFAVGNVDKQKFEKLSQSMRNEFGSGSSDKIVSLGEEASTGPLLGGESLFDSVTPITATPSLVAANPGAIGADVGPAIIAPVIVEDVVPDDVVAAQQSYDELIALQQLVRERAEARGLADAVGFRFENRGLVVTIITDQVLFDESRADLQPVGIEILELVAEVLRATPNNISIEGHTDSRPISSGRYPSNWELSTARATSVLRHLTETTGFDPTRLSAAGYADTRPLASNDTPEGAARNRRVEVVVTSDVSLAPVLEPDA
ncbi:MAG TPA: flagellar motor protein MotB [Ilumatobacteraceae bacterium]|nr:flagellar motor protein MotB [Ilumatobacteraceae bacterium]